MSNLQPNCCLKVAFQKVDQHTGGMTPNAMTPNATRTISCRAWNSPAEYPSWVSRCGIKGSLDNNIAISVFVVFFLVTNYLELFPCSNDIIKDGSLYFENFFRTLSVEIFPISPNFIGDPLTFTSNNTFSALRCICDNTHYYDEISHWHILV